MQKTFALVIVVLAVLVLAGCANASVNPTATAEIDHGAHNMDTAPVTSDLAYIDGMIVHHQGAITMARDALAQAESDDVKQLATQIINAQEAEIMQLNVWRESWYPDAPETDVSMMDMGAMQVEPGDGSYDERWLRAMIGHHQAAIDMSGQLLEVGEKSELVAFAEAVITAQTAEIKQMQMWLGE
jgi:uncharacterized protein (DUF305 family)